MKHKIIISIVFLIFFLGGLCAQETIPATGGDAKGTGGTVNYSVGQVVYSANSGTNGSVTEGVQQPFEIFVIDGIENTSISLEMTAFPNPTNNILNLKIEGEDFGELSIQLFDQQGKIIETRELNAHLTSISLAEQPTATYFLHVLKNNRIVKTFKVIKN